MIQQLSPTLSSMIQKSSGNTNGNIGLFGFNGVQPTPSPKEMLINGFNSPIMQNYYNPYMGFNSNNYNSYGITPFQQNQSQLTFEDLQDPNVIKTLNYARENNITYEQQLNMQTRIAKRIINCVAAVCDIKDEEKQKMMEACEPPPLPSELRKRQQQALEVKDPIRPMTVAIYKGDELLYIVEPEDKNEDFRVKYVSASTLDRMLSAKVLADEKNKRINEELYKSAPERKADEAKNIIDFFNNYGYVIGRASDDYALRKSNISNVTQLYNKDSFMSFMKSMGILGYRDIDNPVVGSYSNPVKFKDSPSYGLADYFNRSPNLAGNAIYDPDSDSVTITAPKFIRDRDKRFDGLPNSINSIYEQKRRQFNAEVNAIR